MFGVGLCRLLTNGEPASAPTVVLRLLAEIEQRAAATPSLDLYRLYRTTTPSAETIAQLCQQLTNDTGPFQFFFFFISSNLIHLNKIIELEGGIGDLSAFETHVLASGLKKLLRELPDPLLPSQWYDAFIEASRNQRFIFF